MSDSNVAIYAPTNSSVYGGDSGFQKFLKTAYQAPMLTQEQEYDYATRLRDYNDLDAAHNLINSYLRYVVKIAREYSNYNLNLADVVQEGTVGLMQAVKKYDPDRGNRLSTYAIWWIRAAIHDYILRSWRMVKIATTQLKRQLFFKLRQAKDSSALLTAIEAEELSKKFGTDTQTILEVDSRMSGSDTSLNQPLLDGSGEMINLIEDQRPNQEASVISSDEQTKMQQFISKGLDKLNPREKTIISSRFLADKVETLESLSEKYSISKERVRQIEAAALIKLKKLFKEDPNCYGLVLEM
ncbi:MAG: RNA polymerase factor sigma-32 [Magnetococcales bacterium]|nr:RNA polymerase factor sigma-32 [Magnetococcales bacterium]